MRKENRICNCGIELTDDIVSHNPYKCKQCFKAYIKAYRQNKVTLKFNRGDVGKHKMKVLFFIKRVKAQDYNLTTRNVHELMTLYEHTFFNTSPDTLTNIDQMVFMWGKLLMDSESYSEKDMIKKIIRIER